MAHRRRAVPVFAGWGGCRWPILAKKQLRQLIPVPMIVGFAYGGQRRHWWYAIIVIGGCHCWGGLCWFFEGILL